MPNVHHNRCPLCGGADLKPHRACRDHTVSQETFHVLRCGACGFRFTQDAPDESAIGAYYQSEDYISHSNTKRGAVSQLYQIARRYMMGRKRALVEGLAGRTSGRLLDYGCGTGEFAAHMKGRGWQALGMEPSEQARAFARNTNGLETLAPDELFTYAGPPFEVITLWHVLEHVHRLRETLDRLRQLLAPGGLMIVAVPNADALEEETYREHWAAWDVPRHLWHFDETTLRRLLQEQGLRVESARPMPLDAFYVSLLSEKYRSGGVNWLGAFSAGLRTWRAARADHKRASSLLYVVRSA